MTLGFTSGEKNVLCRSSKGRAVSAIVPICINDNWNSYVAERVNSVLVACSGCGWEVVVADASRTPSTFLASAIEGLNGTYVHCPQSGVFSPGLARDAGAQLAAGRYLFFFDVDLIFSPGLAEQIHRSMERLARFPLGFLMIPCLYLTKNATRRVEVNASALDDCWQAYLRGEFSGTINLAVASSAIVVDRMTYLSLGGHRPEFAGHGGEDLELINRLTLEAPLGGREGDHEQDVRQDVVAQSRGFRRHFSYYGIPYALQGLILAHRWHPRPITARYFRSRTRNDLHFREFLRQSALTGDCPAALSDLTVAGNTLVCVGEEVPEVQALRQFLPALGRYRVTRERTPALNEPFARVLFVGAAAPVLANRWRAANGGVCGALGPQAGEDGRWRLTWWRPDGTVLVDERHDGIRRFYGDGVSFRWVFHRGVDCLSGRTLYDFVPPDYAHLAALPPLNQFIREQMVAAGYSPEQYPGLFMNQWGQAGQWDRRWRLLRKLMLKPRAFFRDSRVFGRFGKRNRKDGAP